MSCKGLGYKDTTTGTRLYTKSECDELGGLYHGNGECSKAEGGSWSWDCRNEPTTQRATESFGGMTMASDGLMGLSWTTLAGLAVGGYVLYRFTRS
jgi:hypothetical protein